MGKIELQQRGQNVSSEMGVPFVHVIARDRSNITESIVDNAERAVTFLTETAKRKYSVLMEGPPIYLWPPSRSLSWDNIAFIKGWDFTNKLRNRLPDNKRRSYTLIDDINYVPAGVVNVQERIRALHRSSEAIQDSSLFQKPSGENRIVLESDIATQMGSNVCSVLDASFNKQKIIDQLSGPQRVPALHPVAIDKLMLVVVNPDTPEIRAEQLNMFQALYEQLRAHPEYARISKEITRKAINETYFHVWISQKGQVSSISRPYFNSRFLFRDIPF